MSQATPDPAPAAAPDSTPKPTSRRESVIGAERLELADWRRRIADLYATVRAEAATDPEAAWRRWCRARETLFRTHPQSPVPAPDREAFQARHWQYDPALRFEVAVDFDVGTDGTPSSGVARAIALPLSGGYTLALPISTGGEEAFSRLGFVALPLPAGTRRLGLYWMSGYAGGLFLPFRDATSGFETYGAGRYLLDGAKSADLGPGAAPGSLVLDFNFAFQPSCAFDPRWPCPLAPSENRLDVRIEGGERLT